MIKLNSEEKSIFKKIVLAVFTVSISWVVFYEVIGIFDLPRNSEIIIVVALLIVSIVFAFREAKSIASPLTTLSKVMKKSVAMDQMILCDEFSNDEIGVIIKTYNDMAKNINGKNKEMASLNNQLSSSEETLRSQYDQLLTSRNVINESEHRYRSLFELTSEGLFDMDSDFNMNYYSVDWYEQIGVDTSNPEIEEWTKHIVEEDKDSFKNRFDNQMKNSMQSYSSEYKIEDVKGKIHWIRAIAKVTFSKAGEFVSMSGVHRDITMFKEHEEEILKMAYYDRLTGLPNRLKFENTVNKAIDTLDEFSVLNIDIDSFKYINDTYGHQFGDEVIIAMAKRLEKLIDKEDCVSRISGDEFAIMSRINRSKEDAEEFTQHILDKLSVPYCINKLNLSFTASIGVCMYPTDGTTFKDILVNLDIAMSEAKDATKDSYMFYEEQMRIQALEKANIENHLVKSLELDEIYVTYQPVMDVQTKRVKGFEALARWIDAEIGQVFPDVFIPIAEKTGYIHQLGDYVLEQSIIFAKKMFDESGKYYTININVSAIQLHKPEFVDRVLELLVQYQFPAEFVNLEITESVALEMDRKVIDRLAEIRKKDISISLDDFGTGYSSLNNLVNLSVTHIKIDKSLIQQATTLKEVHKLIRGVVEFAHALDLKVVAEGVETKTMENIISDMQIDYTQGYLYAKPLREEDAMKFLEANS